jgi:ribosomal protein L2
VPDAIRAFNEVLRPMGITKCGIRFDSGDMAYLTRKARAMLDDAGWPGLQDNRVQRAGRAAYHPRSADPGRHDRYPSAWASG